MEAMRIAPCGEGGTGDGGRRKRNRQPFLCAYPRLERVRPLPLLSQKATKKRSYTTPTLAWVMADCASGR